MTHNKSIQIGNKKYVPSREACQILGVHYRTLYVWENKGKIDTIRSPGGKRMYNVEAFLNERKCNDDEECIANIDKLDQIQGRLKISYVRVSSMSQKDDLERQKKQIRDKYPKHVMIEDIGSGINLNKRGIRKIINLAIAGRISEVVVAYKDRLARFGYELIESLINDYSHGKIIILNKIDDLEPEQELATDVLQIMNIFVAKMNGLRKYKNKEVDK
jgi:predicted site-specific integrase-resolvase